MLQTAQRRVEQKGWPAGLFWFTICFAAVAASLTAMWTSGDWYFFVQMSRQLLRGSGVHVYADHPNIQSGPISLLAVRLVSGGTPHSDVAAAVAIASLGVIAVGAVVRTRHLLRGPTSRTYDVGALVGGVFVMFWWSYLKVFGHLDDAMTLTIAAVAIMLIASDRRFAAALLIGVALAVKPWAVFLLPLTFDRRHWRCRNGWYPIVSAIVGGLFWAPFVLLDRGTLNGFKPTTLWASDSAVRLFGVGSTDLSSKLRIIQLILGSLAALFAVLRGRYAAALLASIAVRLMLDPATWLYYTAGFVLASFVWDMCVSRYRIPWATLIATYLLAPTWVTDNTRFRVLFRFAACLFALAVALWPEGRGRAQEQSDAAAGEAVDARGRCQTAVHAVAQGDEWSPTDAAHGPDDALGVHSWSMGAGVS